MPGQSTPHRVDHATSEIRHNGLVVARVAKQTQSNVVYTIYTVSDGGAFKELSLPVGQIVVWNGLTLLPGVQYDVVADGIRIRDLVSLSAGDFVSVISPVVPPQPGNGQ